LDAKGRPYGGLANGHHATVAGGNENGEMIFHHELAHLADNARGWQSISGGEPWLALWRADKAAGRVSSFAGQDREPAEYFAESAARFWIGEGGSLSAGVQGYMRTLPGRFAAIA
jgi:hypothetical protein